MNNTNCEHIDWIDGAKGVAIVSVILLHSLPCLKEIAWMYHIGQAVPIFIFITALLSSMHYKSIAQYYSWSRIGLMLKRVFVPFVVVLCLQVLMCQVSGNWWSWKSIVKDGGIGPGSYYIWLYIQVWFMLPIVIEIIKRVPIGVSFLLALSISIVAEYVFVLVPHIEYVESFYRLLPIRYIMVVYAGCVFNQLTKNQKIFFYVLAALSGIMISVHVVDSQCITPPYWKGYHWYTSLYVLIPIAILQRLHYSEIWKMAGKYSWQIFLLQMMCFGF